MRSVRIIFPSFVFLSKYVQCTWNAQTPSALVLENSSRCCLEREGERDVTYSAYCVATSCLSLYTAADRKKRLETFNSGISLVASVGSEIHYVYNCVKSLHV